MKQTKNKIIQGASLVSAQNAITLIALIITIVVMLILAGVTINLTIGNNGIFKTAKQAARNYTNAQNKELADLNSFNNAFANIIGHGAGENTEQLVTEIMLNKTTTEIGVGKTETLTATIKPDNADNKNVIWSSSDNNIVTVSNGTITGVSVGTTTITATAQDGSGKSAICNVEVVWINDGAENRTIDGKTATYQNPIIPVGFCAIDTEDAKWNVTNGALNQWNNGLVIRNVTDGNEFVWVPVDGTNVTYTRWCTNNISYTAYTDVASTSGVDIANNVTKYGGFWVARYEAGLPTNINQTIADAATRNVVGKPLSKPGVVPWNYIDWNNSKANAESMYSNNYVQSGLVNGTQWDTMMKWIENGGKNITDSISWGNYYDSSILLKEGKYGNVSTDGGANWSSATSTINGTSQLIKTGVSDISKAKNIYDLAGNMWEWTCEKIGSNFGGHGGSWTDSGITIPASYNGFNSADYNYENIGFRTQLYIK